MPLVLVAAVALLDAEGRVMIASRPEGKSFAGQWEFPGGKLEKGETPEQALSREMEEEMGITIAPQNLSPLTFVSHAYPDLKFHLLMNLFACRLWQGTPHPKEGQKLAWVSPKDFSQYTFLPADVPLLPFISKML